MHHAADTQAPLHDILKKDQMKQSKLVEWTPEARTAFDNYKRQLENSTLLEHPRPNDSLTLTTDASDTAIGAVIQQGEGDQQFPLAFLSRGLLPTGRKYAAYARELLAIYAKIKQYQHLLEIATSHFTQITSP